MISPEIRLLYWLALVYDDKKHKNIPEDIDVLNTYIHYIQKFAHRQFIDGLDFAQAIVDDLVSSNNN
jgi:hypothetical protein